jgi:hypothetical protein
MTDLSPAAQAVFDAAWAETEITPFDREATLRDQIAAALRAAADQASPEKQVKDIDYVHQLTDGNLMDLLPIRLARAGGSCNTPISAHTARSLKELSGMTQGRTVFRRRTSQIDQVRRETPQTQPRCDAR